jgi:hypothetical protein
MTILTKSLKLTSTILIKKVFTNKAGSRKVVMTLVKLPKWQHILNKVVKRTGLISLRQFTVYVAIDMNEQVTSGVTSPFN